MVIIESARVSIQDYLNEVTPRVIIWVKPTEDLRLFSKIGHGHSHVMSLAIGCWSDPCQAPTGLEHRASHQQALAAAGKFSISDL